jgi:hypothetical protein
MKSSCNSKVAFVAGFLNASLLSNGTVKTWFSPETDMELRPLLAKNLDTAEQDFVRTYRLTSLEAAAFRLRIERDGCASTPVAL